MEERIEWRFREGWSEEELEARLILASLLPLNYRADPARMVPSTGWNHVNSHALVGQEAPGPPRPNDAYGAAKRGVEALLFSDPRVVEPYFDPAAPLLGRHHLFRLKGAGFRFLAPVRVGAVQYEEAPEKTVFAFCLDTLVGHLEEGREWFVLTKEHATGEIRFHIHAAWREAPMPAWLRLGFKLLGRRYQRAWHHLAHLRLREHIQAGRPGFRSAHTPVQFWSGRALSARLTRVEKEHEIMRRDRLAVSFGFGFLTGMRTFLGPTFLGWSIARGGRGARLGPARRLARPEVAWALTTVAVAEMAADKLPGMPARTHWAPLAGRLAAGALVGAGVAARARRARLGFALTGATGALLGAFAGSRVRAWATGRLQIPNAVAGVLEDGAALLLGRGLLGAQGRLRYA